MFHTSLLLPYQENAIHGPNFSQPPPDLIQGTEEYEVKHLINHRCHGKSRMLQYFVKWKGYPESNNTWEPVQNIHAPDLLEKYHRHYPLQDKKEGRARRKAFSRARTTTTCLPMLQMSLLPDLPINCLFPPLPTTTRSPSPHNSLSMSRGKSFKRPPSAMRRNPSRCHHARDSTSSATVTAPSRTQSTSPRGSQPQLRTGRVSTISASYSSRSRLPPPKCHPPSRTKCQPTGQMGPMPPQWEGPTLCRG